MRKNIIQRNVHVIQEIFVQKSKLKNSPCIIIIISIQKMLLLSLAEHACRSLTFKSKSKWRHSIWIWKSVDFSVFFFSLHFQFIFCQYGKTTFQWIVAVFFSYSKCKSYHRFLWAHFICSDDKISGRWRKVKKKNNLRPKSSSVIRALQIYTLENGSRWDKINNFNMFSSSTQRMKNEKKIHPH